MFIIAGYKHWSKSWLNVISNYTCEEIDVLTVTFGFKRKIILPVSLQVVDIFSRLNIIGHKNKVKN